MKLITSGNLAICEYPAGAENPTFTLDADGVLWIEGYSIPLMDTPIRAMKRYETNLIGYTVIGRHEYASKIIKGDYGNMLADVDTDNCVYLIKH